MTSAATLALSIVFIYNSEGKRMEEKAKSFSLVTFVKEADLTAARLLSLPATWTGPLWRLVIELEIQLAFQKEAIASQIFLNWESNHLIIKNSTKGPEKENDTAAQSP